MRSRAAVLLVISATLLLGAVLAADPAEAAPEASSTKPPLGPFGISFAVAEHEDAAVVTDGWLEERLEQANRIFEPAGVSFAQARVRPLGSDHARLDTRRDRHVLGRFVEPRVINCFVVASLRDVDDPSRFRQGVHWRSRTHRPAHYVVLSQIAERATLAHELGHFFGNRRHSPVPGNIMSYLAGEGLPFLDDPQIARIRHLARRYLRTGELHPWVPRASGD